MALAGLLIELDLTAKFGSRISGVKVAEGGGFVSIIRTKVYGKVSSTRVHQDGLDYTIFILQRTCMISVSSLTTRLSNIWQKIPRTRPILIEELVQNNSPNRPKMRVSLLLEKNGYAPLVFL